MADAYFSLSDSDRAEVLAICADQLHRPAVLLEKDAWVVWTLSKLFSAHDGRHLTFKGGTSLSKAYGVIRRFSEDIDLTLDIRHLLPDLVDEKQPLPPNRSQSKKWDEMVKKRLPAWIEKTVMPMLQSGLQEDRMRADLHQDADKLYLRYAPLEQGTGYVRPAVLLEFGARATGEPNQIIQVNCDMENALEGVSFPRANPLVMKIERTFWEKATAAHVFCLQGRIRGERYARHWYDLVCIASSDYATSAVDAKDVAAMVADHKSVFFRESAHDGSVIDYHAAVNGGLKLIPGDAGLLELREDYAAMLSAGLLPRDAPTFDDLMQRCQQLEDRLNAC